MWKELQLNGMTFSGSLEICLPSHRHSNLPLSLQLKMRSLNPETNRGSIRKLKKNLRNSRMNLMMTGFWKNIAEMRETAKVERFGSVVPISGSDFIREVSQASSDVWVVVLLYKDGFPECQLLMKCLEELAKRYPATKFVKIISTDCIPNYPDFNLPTLLVYNNGAVKANYVGLHSFGRQCTPEGITLVLCGTDPVLNDGHSSDSSRSSILYSFRSKLIEKVVADHENYDDGSSSD
ncbi:hypothetical protein Droror1_Dr00015736 [Drosera rotundifolia]